MRVVTFDVETAPNLDLFDLAFSSARQRAERRGENPDGVDPETVKREMALSPLFGRVIGFGILDADGSEPLIWVGDREEEIVELAWHHLEGADLYVSFNGMAFDVPFLELRSSILGIRPTVTISTRRYIWLNHCDLYQLLTAWNGNRTRYLKLDLPTVCRALDVEPPVGDGAEVPKLFEAGNFEAIREHLESDLRATLGIWRALGCPGLVEQGIQEVPF